MVVIACYVFNNMVKNRKCGAIWVNFFLREIICRYCALLVFVCLDSECGATTSYLFIASYLLTFLQPLERNPVKRLYSLQTQKNLLGTFYTTCHRPVNLNVLLFCCIAFQWVIFIRLTFKQSKLEFKCLDSECSVKNSYVIVLLLLK